MTYSMNILVFVVIFLLVMDNQFGANGFVMPCPYYQLNFQKIIGYRPPANHLKSSNLINSKLMFNDEPLNMNCLSVCEKDENCIAYVYLLNTNECYGFSRFNRLTNYETITNDMPLEADSNAIYFEKTCLMVPPKCKNKLWPITKIPGSSLIFQGRKRISSLITNRECVERCLFETDFNCLSASFTPSYKNNQARFEGSARLQYLGSCVLNDKDKNTQPAAYKSGLIDEEYIENECADRIIENISCSYELFSNSSFILPEIVYAGLTQAECQQNCSKEMRFYCQGATYIPAANGRNHQDDSQCFLHSEDSISMGPRSLQHKMNSLYLRRVKCLNISVECKNEEMIINYSPDDWFRGKIYVSSHSEDCSVNAGPGKYGAVRKSLYIRSTIILRLAIGNEQTENKCGILRAYQVSATSKRTFISTLVVIQNNPNVQTQGDRIIKVGCIINSSIDEIDRVPDALALESYWNQNNTSISNENDSTAGRNSNDRKNGISMQIIDLSNRYETNDVQIGQNLELRIIEHPINRFYDLQVVSLLAKANGQSYELIDEHGCSTDPLIFPQLERIVVNDMKVLRAKFSAFKFAGTSQVNFDAIIQFCLLECPIVNCNTTAIGGGRRKKRNGDDDGIDEYATINEAVKVKNILYVTSINKNKRIEANGTEMGRLEVPLSLNINVHEPIWDGKDGLAYGDNGLILASDMVANNETFCVNQSLLVALIIFGAILQIVLLYSCCYFIMRYRRLATLQEDKNSLHTIHENLSYIDGSRRVRWADNSGFTF